MKFFVPVLFIAVTLFLVKCGTGDTPNGVFAVKGDSDLFNFFLSGDTTTPAMKDCRASKPTESCASIICLGASCPTNESSLKQNCIACPYADSSDLGMGLDFGAPYGFNFQQGIGSAYKNTTNCSLHGNGRNSCCPSQPKKPLEYKGALLCPAGKVAVATCPDFTVIKTACATDQATCKTTAKGNEFTLNCYRPLASSITMAFDSYQDKVLACFQRDSAVSLRLNKCKDGETSWGDFEN